MNHAIASTTPNAASAGSGSAVRASTALMMSGVAHQSSTFSMSGAEKRATFSLSASQFSRSSWSPGVRDHMTTSVSRTSPAVKAAAPSHAPPPVASSAKATTASTPVRPPVAAAMGTVRWPATSRPWCAALTAVRKGTGHSHCMARKASASTSGPTPTTRAKTTSPAAV